MAAGTLTTSQFTVGTSSAKIVSSKSTGKGVRVRNTHATNTLFVGDSSVSATTGYAIPPGQAESLPFIGDIYAIASGAGTTGTVLGLS